MHAACRGAFDRETGSIYHRSRLMDPTALQLAMTHHKAGRLGEAEALYKQWLSTNPGQATGLNCYGVLAIQTGRIELATTLLERAVAANPADAHYHCNLGEARRQSSQLAAAIESFREAIRLMPGLAVAHNNLGIGLAAENDWNGAIASYTNAIRLQFNYAEAHGNLGSALKEAGRIEEAVAECRIAVSLKPENAEVHNQLGAALAQAGEIDEAISEYRIAIRVDPKHAEAHTNLGNALAAQGRVQDAVASCGTAVRLRPDSIPAHWNFAVALLRAGDYERGWAEHEWRLRTAKPGERHRFGLPAWNGEALAGKTILLHAEQGFGDTIQFVRYVPMVAALGGRVIVECHRELVRLFSECPGAWRVVGTGETLPAFDQHAPLMSLAFILRTRLATVPASVPYLRASADLAGKWRERLAANVLHVGLCWYGNAGHRNDRERSIPLSELGALAVEGVVFHSLQKEPAGAVPPGMRLIDHSRELSDFAETAALIANLDYVTSVDTAVAHLSGAMGIATSVLLPVIPDWRWMLHRPESAWYPTLRLVRQKRVGEWGEVVERVAKDLSRGWIARDLLRV
jgi:Flp pilus assembly protein TadD